ncbi:MAG TPA: hypothetical protein PLQ97_05345 [Myxococcota bacterium]|nr:hypothetical protein [Myxococcota bacterium]HQK52207.1 hypothetical protein [Myxococcota bacterium]
MDPDQDSRSYLERLESFFLSLVRKGMALRAADVALIREWQQREVPEDLVRRGLQEGVRRFLASADPGAPLPSNLRYYRNAVEAEIAVWQRAREQGRRIGTGTTGAQVALDLHEVAMAHARACLDQAPNDEARALWREALEALTNRHPSQSLLDLLDALDDRLATGLVRCAGQEVWRETGERLARMLSEARQRGAGPEALADLQRAGVRTAAEERAGFRGLLDAVRKASEGAG